MKLTDDETKELHQYFKHTINYYSDNPEEPIDPLSYVAPDGDNCLHIASFNGDYRIVELLIKSSCIDINATGDMGDTPLHYAYRRKHNDIIKLLLKYGASDEIINEFRKKPSEYLNS